MFRHDEERKIMDLKRQASAPLYEAIETFRKKRIVPFDVPGHKRGRGNPELVDYFLRGLMMKMIHNM